MTGKMGPERWDRTDRRHAAGRPADSRAQAVLPTLFWRCNPGNSVLRRLAAASRRLRNEPGAAGGTSEPGAGGGTSEPGAVAARGCADLRSKGPARGFVSSGAERG